MVPLGNRFAFACLLAAAPWAGCAQPTTNEMFLTASKDGGGTTARDSGTARDLRMAGGTDSGTPPGCTTDGQCADPKTPFCDKVSGRCVACDPKADRCAAGKYCATQNGVNSCVPGCKTNMECIAEGGDSSLCCAHACDDINTSVKNCGACGTACPPGGACCGGGCADVTSDPSNCGGCGIRCSANNAQSRCNASNCEIAACNGGWGDCNRNALDGCETDLDNDDFNCGRCGHECVFVCIDGSCFPF